MGGTPFRFAVCIHARGGHFFREVRLGVYSREVRVFRGDGDCGVIGFGGLSEYFVGHVREGGAAQWFGV